MKRLLPVMFPKPSVLLLRFKAIYKKKNVDKGVLLTFTFAVTLTRFSPELAQLKLLLVSISTQYFNTIS